MLKTIKARLIPSFLLKIKAEELNNLLAKADYQEIQSIFSNGALRSPHLPKNYSPYFILIQRNDLKLIKLAKKFGASLFSCNKKGETLLHLCCLKGSLEIFNYLLKKKLLLDKPDKKGYLPIHKACESVDFNLVEKILTLCPDQLNENSNEQKTSPLHIAVKSSSEKLVQYLLHKGADINILSNEGTPFMLASCFSTEKITEMLIEAGADIEKGNHLGAPVISITRFGRNNILFKLIDQSKEQLFKKCPDTGDDLLHIAIANSNITAAKKLVELGLNPNERNNNDKSSMNTAIELKSLELINLLLRAGYKTNAIEEQQIEALTAK